VGSKYLEELFPDPALIHTIFSHKLYFERLLQIGRAKTRHLSPEAML
jgi:hypothetical protein